MQNNRPDNPDSNPMKTMQVTQVFEVKLKADIQQTLTTLVKVNWLEVTWTDNMRKKTTTTVEIGIKSSSENPMKPPFMILKKQLGMKSKLYGKLILQG